MYSNIKSFNLYVLLPEKPFSNHGKRLYSYDKANIKYFIIETEGFIFWIY